MVFACLPSFRICLFPLSILLNVALNNQLITNKKSLETNTDHQEFFHYESRLSKKTRKTSAPPINVPIELPMFANTTINKIRVTLLSQNPFTESTSSGRVSKSDTCGFRINAWTMPANQPAANRVQ